MVSGEEFNDTNAMRAALNFKALAKAAEYNDRFSMRMSGSDRPSRNLLPHTAEANAGYESKSRSQN
jgi:hypothetical protein